MPETATPAWATLDTAEKATLERQVHRLRARIAQAGGALSFAEFMEGALYDPEIGYYSHRTVFGAAGDFITAPALSPLFGQCLARQCAQILRQTPGPIIEVGGGGGRLAVDILQALDALGISPMRYVLIERSARRREEARILMAREIPEHADRIVITDAWPAMDASVILANELLDALPVTRFRVHQGQAHPLLVCAESDAFGWREGPADAQMTEALETRGWPEGYTSEISWAARKWIGEAATRLNAGGLLLVIDYGFPAPEFYHPQRHEGTLMCHFRHHAHGDPLVLMGLQDITTHVDFTALAESGQAAGLAVAGYTSQAAFLLSLGLAPRAQGPGRAHMEEANAIKRLTLPHEMGELFKVMAFTRGDTAPLAGFHLLDRSRALARR
ncbi:MAG: SAM-dependent methyltransferase [Gammaproteobacteria bacterium]|nr:SAM-dependent methyltransferase [Gammaproteobacteria bacterium]